MKQVSRLQNKVEKSLRFLVLLLDLRKVDNF